MKYEKISNLTEKVVKFSELKVFLLSIYTVIALTMSYDAVSDEIVSNLTSSSNSLYKMIIKVIFSIPEFSVTTCLLTVFIYMMYKYSYELGKCKIEEKVIGVLMALTMLFGKAFEEYSSTIIFIHGISQIIKTILILIGYLFFYVNIVKVLRHYMKNHFKLKSGFDMESAVIYRRVVFAFFVIIWSVHIIGYYPGMFMGDTEDVLYMAYNYHTVWADTVELISPDVLLVDHHSVLYTLILGFFVKTGRALFESENIGLFLYTVLQALFTAWVLAYSLYKLKKYNVNAGIRTIILLFFAFFPWIPRYAIMATKDTLFADLLLLYIFVIVDIVEKKHEKISPKLLLLMVVYSALMFLLRKNGLYVTILSLPFMIKLNKSWIKPIVVTVVSIIVIQLVYGNVLLPAARITDGSMSAALSVPLQQTARYAKYYGNEITEEERAAIDAVSDCDELAASYWPDRSDWAKATWKKDAKTEDIVNYFVTWAKMLFKHPLTYVAATANNCHGYFYPVVLDLKDFERSHTGGMSSTNRDGYFNFSGSDSKLSMFCRDMLKLFDEMLMHTPILNLLCTSAVYIWLLIITWTRSIVRKDTQLFMLIVPMLMLMLTILTGPCNGNIYDRFTYPVAMCMPVIAGYAFRNNFDCEDNEQV